MVNSQFKMPPIHHCVTMPVETAQTMRACCSELGNHESRTPSEIRYLNDVFAHLLTLLARRGDNLRW
jgi:hypothetical protein